MLNFIYYPVSFILWVWHKVFGFLLGDPANGIAWALSVVFLVFTLRILLFKPFVSQVRSMRKMQEFQPEMAKLRKKYPNDRQKQAVEMQRLQKEHGVNPIMGCLPALVQLPVFIGLFQVLRNFTPLNSNGTPRTENYFFGRDEVISFYQADFFGAKLANWPIQGEDVLRFDGTSVGQMLVVMIPLMIAAGIFTHITARHSVARQTAAQGENPQTAIMNKLMLYVFPIGVVVGAPFLPLAILIYWVANNLWTLGQQFVVYRWIDAEETVKREQAVVLQKARAPRPGQKPVRPEDAEPAEPPAKTPGAKPVKRNAGAKKPPADGSTNGAPTDGAADVQPSSNGSAKNGAAKNGAAKNGSAKSGAPRPGKDAAAARSGRAGSRPPARRSRKRR